MAIHVSKFLRFACSTAILQYCNTSLFDWLFDMHQLLGYIQKLERSMIGPEGQINNLDTNDVALSFQMLDEKDLRHAKIRKM